MSTRSLESEQLVIVAGASGVECGGLGFRFGRDDLCLDHALEGGGWDVRGSRVRPRAERGPGGVSSNVHDDDDSPRPE